MNEPLRNIKDGDRIYGQYLLADVKKGVTTGGRKYLTITLQDNSASVEAKKWDVEEGDDQIFVKGNVVSIQGEAILYKDTIQIKIYSGEVLGQDNINWSRFVPSAPFDLGQLRGKFEYYVNSISDPNVSTLAKAFLKVFEDRYLNWPAAVRNHHNYIGGLLYHSTTMADLAEQVCRIYPNVNRDVVIAGVLIHDVGKTIELSGPYATEFTLEGRLLGHISIGQAELRKVAKELGYFAYDELKGNEDAATKDGLLRKKEIAVVLEHIILSHHTKPEFGSPVPPLTQEAVVVAMVDDLDAKMNILDKAYDGVKKGESTARIFTMDDRYFYKPLYSKDEPVAPGLKAEDLKK